MPFDWSNVTGAASYTLQVGSSSAFTTVVLTRTVTASQVSAALTRVGGPVLAGAGEPGRRQRRRLVGRRSIRIR